MFRPSMTSLRAGRVIAPSPAPAMPRMFATSSLLRTDISSSALPKQKPVGAFRGGIFGFLLGSVAAGVSVYYYVLKEYRVSNELLTDDIYVRGCRIPIFFYAWVLLNTNSCLGPSKRFTKTTQIRD
ncbi:conserved hypothetical protein [Talaromyces stipitatus ATCC 10500]|uniref:Uncharacterized protein n=1 Tax=Talaromyces stipitatus (strain ATCC 10500 / CBS 375.48 / QM 6759 / NRRL 1006) TaxID=441959 RepID=B8LT14_TALSN|nr:uncharacterized protein TSTA_069420 [Talaromyces stipitatus ATCC 10500]EED23522.1 conserved hypothetical protein [Talaromyces stipitatus ATCC 10500]